MTMRTFGAVALLTSLAAAQTTLYIPGFDPQAITANEVGTDASGHTTWVIGPGATSGTYEDPAGIVGSATLVAGATDAHLVYEQPLLSMTLSEDCGINNGVAVCTAVANVDGTVATVVETETATGFVVQGNAAGATATGAASGSSASAGSGATSGASATGGSGTAAASGTSAASTATSTSGSGNGAGRVGTSTVLSVGVVGLVSAFFL